MIILVHCDYCGKDAYLSLITARRQSFQHANKNYCLPHEPHPTTQETI